jgi:FlaG/FlaF family flagellin (archaellin)
MKIDTCTKAILTVIAVMLTVIALRPLVSPESASAQAGAFTGIQYSHAQGDYTFFDSRTGDIWVYVADGTILTSRVTKLGAPLLTKR